MGADEALTGVGELIFSLIIGYLGALEFAFVARHLYHCIFRHPCASTRDVDNAADNEELPRLRERLDKDISKAKERETLAGSQVMQDGVPYSQGFRLDSEGDRQKALAAELERQQCIEQETRRQLAEAEAKLAEERNRLEAEKQRECLENERKLQEAEKQRAAEQRERELKEEAETNTRNLIEAEKQREEQERMLLEAEKQCEEQQRILLEAQLQLQREENERKLAAAEQERLEIERLRELAEAETRENEQRLFQAELLRQQQQREEEQEQAQRDAEIVERLLAAERERNLSATESELEEEESLVVASKTNLENKQKMIEENARRFLEAEEEMVVLQQRLLQAAQASEQDSEYAGCLPVVEEPCIKKILPPRFEEPKVDEEEEPLIVRKVKTQYGQTGSGEEPFLVKSKTLTFPGVSDEGSSLEPNSSQRSSFSTQPSEEQRPEPEGEDHVPDVQYTEDYLRSLDGIKSRPLVREDGSGRRRAFKKRRSSGSSNSSRDSRASRDEELKMFTSLEEEELRHGDREDYNPIKYSSEPTLKVKSQHHRRHKRSPAKDLKPTSPAEASGSLEMLGEEEGSNPWGEVVPEHYKDTEFWKREKALSINEEDLDLEKQASGEEVIEPGKNEPQTSSFEEASEAQNKEAADSIQQNSKDKLQEQTESPQTTETKPSDNKSNTCS